jgi:hypothetical protein
VLPNTTATFGIGHRAVESTKPCPSVAGAAVAGPSPKASSAKYTAVATVKPGAADPEDDMGLTRPRPRCLHQRQRRDNTKSLLVAVQNVTLAPRYR